MVASIFTLKKIVKLLFAKIKNVKKRRPKIWRYLEGCRFQSQCSYSHKKEGVLN